MYKLEEKTIEGLSPLIVNAENENAKIYPKGYTKQETRSGKNILYVADKEETTDNRGITYSIKNGIITFNGTSTNAHYITLTNSLFNINAGTYTISTKVLSGSYSGVVGKQVNIDASNRLFDGGYIGNTVTVEVQNQQENVYLAFYIGSNAVFNNYKIAIQLEEGSVATEYEQYGAMPSPEFPIEIQNVEGNVNITVANENIVLNGYATPKTDTEFWRATSSNFTPLEDGWGKFDVNNLNGASDAYSNAFIAFKPFKNTIKSNTKYKMIIELRNVSLGNNGDDYFSISSNVSNEAFYGITLLKNEIKNGKITKIVQTKDNLDSKDYLFRSFLAISAGNSTSLEVRISLLEENSTQTEVVVNNKKYIFPLSERQKLYEGSYLAEDGIHHVRNNEIVDENTDIYIVKILDKTIRFSPRSFSTKENGVVLCNKFKYINDNTLDEEHCGIGAANKYTYFWINKERLETQDLNGIKKWLANNPLNVEYELESEEVEPYTEEQQQVIDSMQTLKGYNNILVTDSNNNPLNITLQYRPQMTEEIRNAFLTDKTYGYITILDTGEQIKYDNYLKNIKFEDLKYVPDQGIFGGAVAKRVTLEFNNEAGNVKIENKEFDLRIGVNYQNEYYYIKYGRFIVQKPNTETTTDNTSFSALDYMTKLNEPYVDNNTYPCTLREVAENLCIGTGLTLSPKHFRNEDFIVENNQFVSGESKRNVAQAIALSAFSWARVNEENELCFDLENKQDFDIEINSDNYYNLSKNDELYGPINRIVMRDSQIEGENVTIQDDESVEKYGINELTIKDNPFAYTQEKRTQLIQAAKELYGFNYMPINSANLTGYLFLNCLDRIRFVDMQGNTFDTYLFDHTIDYTGISLDTVSTKAMTKTQTQYAYTPTLEQAQKRTEIMVDKQNQTITALASSNEELTQRTAQLQIDVDSIKSEVGKVTGVTTTNEGYGELIFEGINESEPIMIKIHPTVEDIIPLRPHKGLYPRVGLRPHSREIVFKRTDDINAQKIQYNIPKDLYKLDNTYDEFVLDYENQKCYIIHRIGINSSGEKYLLQVENTENFEYPLINLLEGDYVVNMPAFPNAYMYVTLMTKNIYTSQFATKVELNSKIEQTAQSIDLSVNKKLSNYSTTQEMNSAINLRANEIMSSVSETYATKATTNSLSTRIKQTAKSIDLVATDNKTSAGITIRLRNEDGTQIDSKTANITLSGLVKFTDLSTSGSTTINGSNITTGTINANKVSVTNLNASNITTGTLSASRISGGSLSLTGNNTTITSTNFSVNKDGVITAKSGTIGGITLGSTGLYSDNFGLWRSNIHDDSGSYIIFHAGADNNNIGGAPFRIYQNGKIVSTAGTIGGWKIDSGSLTKQTGNYSLEIRADRPATDAAILVWDNKNQTYNFYVRPDGYLYAKNAEINGKINATSGTFKNCTITESCSVPGSIISGTISGVDIDAPQMYCGSLKAQTISADSIGLNNEFGAYTAGGYIGRTIDLNIPNFGHLKFVGGILVEPLG